MSGPSHSPFVPQAPPFYGDQPPMQPGMSYGPQYPQPAMVRAGGPPLPPPWVLLGFREGSQWSSQQVAVYGPPGAQFDLFGNIYFVLADGQKQYILPYRGADGTIRTPPDEERFCC